MLTKTTIKRFRERQGWSREHLGKLIGVSEQAVWTWERGDRKPSGPAEKLLRQLMEAQDGA